MKKIIILQMAFLLLSFGLNAQKNSEIDIKYRRSSLHTILMESDRFPYKDTIIDAYYSAPFPDKYNEHYVVAKSFNPLDFPVTLEDRIADSIKQSKGGAFLKGLASNISGGIIDSEIKDYPIIIGKYFEHSQIAKQIVAKWFNRQPNGAFDMNLIGERGFYDASEMQKDIAKGAARGNALLADAGEELIKNTFVVIAKMNFVSNEKVAALTRDIAILKANEMNALMRDAAIKAAEKFYEKTKDGYSVWTTAFLYQLEWNDSIAAVFYQDYWIDQNSLDENRKKAFEQSNLFKMNLIGSQKATSLVVFSGEGKATPAEILKVATIRNVDRVYAKLQKKYDVFQVKTPIFSVNPVTAKIGKKEGLKGGEKFEILEQVVDSKTGLTKYVSKGRITVDKSQIWDNRFNLEGKIIDIPDEVETEEETSETEKADENNENIEQPKIEATVFKGGGKNLYPGLLIKQVK
jgi:hypothetical protein